MTYSASIIGLRSGRGRLMGSTPRPNQDFLLHRLRQFERHRWRVRAESQPDLRSRPKATRCCGPLARVDERPGDPGAQLQACPNGSCAGACTESNRSGSVMFELPRLRRTRLQRTESSRAWDRAERVTARAISGQSCAGLSATRAGRSAISASVVCDRVNPVAERGKLSTDLVRAGSIPNRGKRADSGAGFEPGVRPEYHSVTKSVETPQPVRWTFGAASTGRARNVNG